MRKKLLFVTLTLGYGVGGSEKALIEMLKCLDLDKYDVSILCLTEKSGIPFERRGIRVMYGCNEYLHMAKPLRQVLKNPFRYSIRQLITKCRVVIQSRFQSAGVPYEIMWERFSPYIPMNDEEYDVVIGYGPGLATFYAIDKVHATKKVLWLDTDLSKAHYDVEFSERFYLSADQVVVVDYSGIERFCEIYPKLRQKVCTIRNIIPVDEIKNKASEGLGFTDGYEGVRILSVGRLCEAKAFHLAVGAADILKKKGYSFRWYIVGWGALEDELRKQINDCGLNKDFILLGQQMNPYPFFAQTDIYVQTSIYEGSCITVEEAMILNIPTVSTNFPAIYNKIIDGKNGFIVEMSSEAIANCVERLIDNKKLRGQITNYLQQYPLSYDEIIDCFDKMVENL